MNIQNAKNLVIPEGSVKNIHDKDGRLLWGAVGYDTTYRGDTTQITYSGKNLFNKAAAPNNSDATSITELPTGVRATVTGGGSFKGASFVLFNVSDFVGQTVTLSATFTQGGTNVPELRIGLCASDGTNPLVKVTLSSTGSVSYTIQNDTQRQYLYIRVYSAAGPATVGGYNDYTNLQVEISSTATSYEPFVGGIPAPNPDYPQTVNVVTGVQTVTVSDGGSNTQTFTIDLGATELCKIGGYQDYIYKSGSDWYVRKAVGKVVYNGSEDWGLWAASAEQPRRLGLRDTTLWFKSSMMLASNYFIRTTYSGSQTDLTIWTQTQYLAITDKNSYWSSYTDFKTWLSTHNLIVYYELRTPTDTQITDATLISQLNAVHEWLTRYGYNATVSGNLPLIVDRTNL